MELNEPITRRLAFIKYMYKVAIEQSYKPEPLCSISLLTFHDAIESFSQLSAEFLNIKLKSNMDFMEYWNRIDKLTLKESMHRLNKARVNLKHHGIMPSKLEIEGFRASTTNFFEENVPIVFNIEFSGISLTLIVHHKDVKNNLKEAEDSLKEGKTKNAFLKVGVAFNQLINHYKNREIIWSGYSPLLHSNLDLRLNKEYKNELGELAEDVDEVAGEVEDLLTGFQEIVRILIWGIDYRKYIKFKKLIPDVVKGMDGSYMFAGILPGLKREIPSPKEIQSCIDFIIESAIILQEFYSGEM